MLQRIRRVLCITHLTLFLWQQAARLNKWVVRDDLESIHSGARGWAGQASESGRSSEKTTTLHPNSMDSASRATNSPEFRLRPAARSLQKKAPQPGSVARPMAASPSTRPHPLPVRLQSRVDSRSTCPQISRPILHTCTSELNEFHCLRPSLAVPVSAALDGEHSRHALPS